MWEVIYSEEWEEWFESLEESQQVAIVAAVDVLRLKGPTLGRPLVDRINGSQFQNMKELRVSEGGQLRTLFAFDSQRRAVLLVGGNKAGEWTSWYDQHISQADAIFGAHQAKLSKEGR